MILKIDDDKKRTLYLPAAPKRVVSLVPSDTYNVAALGCASALVGRTDYCELPADVVAKLPSVGGTKNPKIDAICDLSPDLVLANQEENTRADLEKLTERGVKVLLAFPKRVADGIAGLARLARVFRVEKDAAVRALIKRGYEQVREAEADLEMRTKTGATPVTVFCPIWAKPLMTINGETFINDMLALAGATNVFADRERRYPLASDLTGAPAAPADGRDTRYPRVTLDEVLSRKPDLVLLPDEPHPFTEEEAAEFRKALGARVVPTSGKDLCWYGARSVEGLPRVRALVAEHRAKRSN